MTGDDYLHALKALLPPGAAWQAIPSSDLEALLGAWADEFARVDGQAQALVTESDPRTAVELLGTWQTLAGLTDAEIAEDALTQQIQQQVAARIADDGDVSGAGWIARGAQLGHAVTLNEFVPSICGVARCGDTLAPVEVRFVLNVTTKTTVTTPALCGVTVCGDRMGAFTGQRLVNEFNRVKQAHTGLVFTFI